jgi:hypothetical protein
MEAAKIAAETLAEAFQEGNLTAGRLKVYQQRWRKAFGWDFWLYASLSLSHSLCVCAYTCVRVVSPLVSLTNALTRLSLVCV